MKDDDEEEENTFGVTRYPCMPSLVALQQMRNRLHLAFLGRKLMKWTALATGRELRRLAGELYELYQGFGEDLRNAFIMLARSRYFCPQLNYIVTENIGRNAGVVVQQSMKAVSGVKIVQFEIFETENPPYAHLGLEKGGQAILEAKKAWLDLLKRLIMMMQLRASFLMVEIANKNATKKMNVLAKIVIPKTHVTMGYINNELEELAREEFFRLKKVLEIKRRMYGGNEDKKKEKPKDVPICETCMRDIEKKDESLTDNEDFKPMVEEDKTLKLEEIERLIRQLAEIVDVTKEIEDKGLVDVSVEEFIKTAEELKGKLGQKSEIKEEDAKSLPSDTSEQEDDGPKVLCDTCREKYEGEQKDVQRDDVSVGTESTTSSRGSRETVQFKESSSPSLSDDDSESDLDTFETEYKEITKIIKTKNKDGSITIKKKVIKVEKEIKSPARSKSLPSSSRASSTNRSKITSGSSNSSTKSNPYSRSKTIGLVAIKSVTEPNNVGNNLTQRKVKSEVLTSFSPMSDPVERLCISSITLLSTDLDVDLTRTNDYNKKCLKLSNNAVEEFFIS